MIHAAEGLDAAAQAELDTLDRLGCLAPNTVFIHGVAFCRAAADRVIAAGAGLVWCPSSNQFLFEPTADVRAFDDADRLALGSDSRLSGERDLLDELRVGACDAAAERRRLGAHGRRRRRAAAPAWTMAAASRPARRADLTVFAAARDLSVRHARRRLAQRRAPDDDRAASRWWRTRRWPRVFDATGVDSSPALLDGSPRLVARWIGRHVQRMRTRRNPASRC